MPAAEVARALGTDPALGLSIEEVAQRRARHGPNRLDARPPVPAWRKLLLQLRDPLVYLLLGAVLVSLAAWVFEGAQGWPFEALVVLGIVAANAVLGYVEESRAERAVAALQRMTEATATLWRAGTQQRLPALEVVPGGFEWLMGCIGSWATHSAGAGSLSRGGRLGTWSFPFRAAPPVAVQAARHASFRIRLALSLATRQPMRQGWPRAQLPRPVRTRAAIAGRWRSFACAVFVRHPVRP